MKFDWFTIAAQAINLIILIFLLHRFLYKPVSKAMEKRKEEIREKFEKADKLIVENSEKKEELKKKRKELETQKDDILLEAKKGAEDKRNEIIEEAKQVALDKKEKWLKNFEKEKKKLLDELRRDNGLYVFKISKKVLKDIADRDIESQIIRKFGVLAEELIEKESKDIKQILKKADANVTIESSFEINDEQKEVIEKNIKNKIKIENINYDINKDMIAGISLSINGHKVKWSIEDHLNDLEDKYLNRLNEIKEKDQKK